MNFMQQARYVEERADGGDIVSCSQYRRHHIFKTEDGQYHIVLKIAGVGSYKSLMDAVRAIDSVPNTFFRNKNS